MLTSREGVGATAMDTSRDTVFVGDSDGYIHALSLHLKNGQLQPLLLLARVPPPGCAQFLLPLDIHVVPRLKYISCIHPHAHLDATR